MSDKPLAYSYLRISTDNQRHGSGIERQMKAGAAWAEANGYELAETISDIGLSAYTSTHAKKGGFGRFLAAIETGQVPAGSILIVESLDRLSRAKVTEAFTQLVGLLKHGIKIVTLVDNQVYTESSLNENFGQLFMSLGVLLRANDESETKSKRGKAAWHHRRQNAAKKKITKNAPAWLELSVPSRMITLILADWRFLWHARC